MSNGKIHVKHLSVQGRFDFAVHKTFKEHYMEILSTPEITEVNIDLEDVKFIDTAALGMLVLLLERAQKANKSVVLTQSSGMVSDLLHMANFDKIFAINDLDGKNTQH